MTYREAFAHGEEVLHLAQIAEAKNDAWLLFARACRIDRTHYFVHMDEEISQIDVDEYKSLIKKRAEHVPLQYITGEQEFMGLNFRVNPSVLIPRQDTETLVEEALKHLALGMRVLDMCTGSGCVLISILRNVSSCSGVGVDISKQAINVAKENAKMNEVNAEFEKSDLFENVSGVYDMIVSNPPYIPSDVIPTLMPEVAEYEPHLALDGKEDGLFFYRRIVSQSKGYLKEGGYLLFEIGCDQGEDLREMMNFAGYKDIQVIKDLSGNNRVVCGHL